MTNFLLFAVPTYYPSGGLHDCRGVFDTRAEAEAEIARLVATSVSHMEYHVLQLPEMIGHEYEPDGTYAGIEPLSYYTNEYA